MKRILSIIGVCVCALAYAGSTVTIPLHHESNISDSYTVTESADDPGSSTVDPVDPNQAKAELTGNTLKVYEGLEGNAQISVYNMTSPQLVMQTNFDESITLILTDTAQYIIQLYHPSIGLVSGAFRYPIDNAHKIMQDGSVYIFFNNQFYTPFGVKMW